MLTSSFTSVTIEKKDASSDATAQNIVTEPTESASGPSVSKEERDKWEQEQVALQAQWKEESARQRKEAEERRAHIAAERSATGDTWEKLDQERPPRGPPIQPVEHVGYPGSPSPADARDSVAGEPSGSKSHALETSQVGRLRILSGILMPNLSLDIFCITDYNTRAQSTLGRSTFHGIFFPRHHFPRALLP